MTVPRHLRHISYFARTQFRVNASLQTIQRTDRLIQMLSQVLIAGQNSRELSVSPGRRTAIQSASCRVVHPPEAVWDRCTRDLDIVFGYESSRADDWSLEPNMIVRHRSAPMRAQSVPVASARTLSEDVGESRSIRWIEDSTVAVSTSRPSSLFTRLHFNWINAGSSGSTFGSASSRWMVLRIPSASARLVFTRPINTQPKKWTPNVD